MKSLPKTLCICLFALTANFSVNASPTFVENCFDTEAEAKRLQSAYERRDVDNSPVTKKENLIRDLVKQDWDNVELSSLKKILGPPEDDSNYTYFHTIEETTISWSLYWFYSPSSSGVQYEASRGYCVSTRHAPTGKVNYLWTPDFPGSAYGKLVRHSASY